MIAVPSIIKNNYDVKKMENLPHSEDYFYKLYCSVTPCESKQSTIRNPY